MAHLKERSPIEVRLFLDDNRPPPIGWTVARSVKEAINIMENWTVVHVSLDYDLGACSDCIRNDPEAARMLHCCHVPDGMVFLQWMIDNEEWPRLKPVVHSRNNEWRPKMQTLIDLHWVSPQ